MKCEHRSRFYTTCLLLLLALVAVCPDLAISAVMATRENPFFGSQVANESWYATRWGQLIIAAFLGGLFGVFFSQQFKEIRKWVLLVFAALTALAAAVFNQFLGNLVVFVVSAGIAYSLLRVTIVSAGRRKKPTTFGSAEWADLEHLQQNNLVGKQGFVLGVFPTQEESHPLHYTGDRHLLTVAPTRSGKGVSSIIPNLLTYEGSAVVIDPKGENAMITAARRGKGDKKRTIQGMGQTVHVVDPWGITGLPSSRFNPLDWLDPADPDVNENAMLLADSIITPHAGGHDQFWDEEGVVCGRGRNPTLRLWPAIFSGEIDVFPSERRNMGQEIGR